MPENPERRRRLLEKKATKRKERRRTAIRSEQALAPPSSRALTRAAASWPLYECWINKNWNDVIGETGAGLAQMIVARRSSTGQIGVGVFLADLGCLGVKNAFARVFPSESAYAPFFEHLESAAPLTKVDLSCVAKVVNESISYAKRWGFRPHQDYYEAAPFLEGAHPEECEVEVPLGKNGRPFYVSGPNDNPKKIVAQLMRTAGPGNFDYIAHVPAGELVIPAHVRDEPDGDETEEQS